MKKCLHKKKTKNRRQKTAPTPPRKKHVAEHRRPTLATGSALAALAALAVARSG